ncbi:DUF2851 family protein [Leadbetterella sp. DM7]|uniref:DUF2851 family protein n=1 Tax=Leadbetterella sp. DM7 TaxID=3235085 RepID=UPI00349EBE10
MKNEELLHYVWQYQLFDAAGLQTDDGQMLRVIKTGTPHSHAGPDFENARIALDGMIWAGKVEIHLLASDWEKHGHQHDAAYDAVILHVVWKNDRVICRRDGTAIPALSLHERIPAAIRDKYRYLKNSQKKIPCESLFGPVLSLSKVSMIEKALAFRLQRKAEEVLQMYRSAGHDLEETAYQLLMKNFGFHLNSEAFLRLARALPHKILARYRGNSWQMEALLFGLAGFLEEPADAYARRMHDEYRFLKHKHDLSGNALSRSDWKFLRTRPHNFPTVRLAQVATLLNCNGSFFNACIENRLNLDSGVSAYWQSHYDFAKPGKKFTGPGKESVDNLRINTIVPLLAAYYRLTGNDSYFNEALRLLEDIPPEKNFITRLWDTLNLKSLSAFDSQGLIEQYNELCTQKKCLQCPVGLTLLKL